MTDLSEHPEGRVASLTIAWLGWQGWDEIFKGIGEEGWRISIWDVVRIVACDTCPGNKRDRLSVFELCDGHYVVVRS
jgi:hypothetical protein